jgi:broad specificity phosphatase PhoE
MVTLVLVRHGLTNWNRERRYQGQTDIPLNEDGIRQASHLASQLAAQGPSSLAISAIYSSDLQRAAQTAWVLARSLRLPVQLDRRLREIALGAWEGQLIADISAGLSSQAAASSQLAASNHLVANSDHRAVGRMLVQSGAPGGETLEALAARVSQAADDISRAHAGETVLVVSHGMALAALSCLAHGAPIQRVYDFTLENCVPVVVHWPAVAG